MTWTVIVPVNFGRDCKTRLAARLTAAQRNELVVQMADHVLQQLRTAPSIGDIHVLSPVELPVAHEHWLVDEGRGLNAELAAARATFPRLPIAFIHADLPFLRVEEIEELLSAAALRGAAIAPDRLAEGTNAVAIADNRPFAPAFGLDSFARHKAVLPDAAVVVTPGLSFDLDGEDCLDLAITQGLLIPPA